MSALRKNVASQVVTFGLVNASSGAALTGATVTTKATLDGTQSSGSGTVTELGSGQYKYVPTQGETNGTTLGLLFTATSAIPVNLHCFITAMDPTDAVRGGMTALPNAAAEAAGGLYTRGTGAGQLSQSANGELGVVTLAKTATTLTNAPSDSSGVTTLLSRIPSGLFTGITSLAQWLGLIAGKQTGNSTARTEIRATGAGSGTYDETTDSQEALRDNVGTNGAALSLAKTTNITGFNDLSAAQVNAEADTALADVGVTTTVTGRIDAAVSTRLASAGYTTPPTAGAIADQVWEETLADHSGTSGSTAAALNAAGSAGDPWNTALPGAYGSGTAGKIIGDNIDATISSRSTYGGGDTSGTTTLLSRLSATRAGYLDNLSAGAVALEASLQSLITTIGASAAGVATAVWGAASRTLSAFGFSVTASTVSDKTGYSLTSGYDPAKTAAQAGDAMALTSGERSSTATAVWASGTRTLTAATNLSIPSASDNATATAAAVTSDHGSGSYVRNTEPLDAAGVRTAVGLGSANLDTQLGDLPTNSELATALAAADDAVLAAISALSVPTSAENASALLATAYEGAETVQQGLRLIRAALVGKASGMATSTAKFRSKADDKDRITATVTADGDRTAVTTAWE